MLLSVCFFRKATLTLFKFIILGQNWIGKFGNGPLYGPF